MAFDPRLRSPKEQPLFTFGVIFSACVWLSLCLIIVGLIYIPLVAFGIVVAHSLFLAYVRGNGVRVSENQLPALYERVRLASAKLGLEEIPSVYVLQAGGSLNAFATKLFSRRFVVIFSDLVDNCHDVRHLDFVIGHELSHLAAGHLKWKAFLLPFHILPWLGPAYSRACEYTCDRGGHHVVGNLEASMRGLCVLASGGKLAGQMNLQAFMDQRMETGGFWMSIYELVASHPYLCKRVAALRELEAPGSVQPVPRSFFGWVFAPMLGVAAGGGASIALVVIVYIAIVMAAVAVPAFQEYSAKAELQAAQQQDQGEEEAFEDAWAEEAPDEEDAE